MKRVRGRPSSTSSTTPANTSRPVPGPVKPGAPNESPVDARYAGAPEAGALRIGRVQHPENGAVNSPLSLR